MHDEQKNVLRYFYCGKFFQHLHAFPMLTLSLPCIVTVYMLEIVASKGAYLCVSCIIPVAGICARIIEFSL